MLFRSNGGKELAAFIAEDQGINVESIVEPDHYKVGKWARPESSPARPSREVSVEPFSATPDPAAQHDHSDASVNPEPPQQLPLVAWPSSFSSSSAP